MKEIKIYLHGWQETEAAVKGLCSKSFKQLLQEALRRYQISVTDFAISKDDLLQVSGSGIAAVYLPSITKQFVELDHDLSIFTSLKERVELQTGNVVLLSVIADLLPVNLASFQPYLKLSNDFVQPQLLELTNAGGSKRSLIQLFQTSINCIAEGINQQLERNTCNNSSEKSVFIAHATSDLEEAVQLLCNSLIEKNKEVVTPVTAPNLSKNYYAKRVNTALENSWLCIHPLGVGEMPLINDAEGALNVLQMEAELSANHLMRLGNRAYFKRIVWVPKHISLTSYEGRLIDRIRSQTLQNKNGEVLECSLDELEDTIEEYHRQFQDFNKDGSLSDLFEINETLSEKNEAYEYSNDDTVFVFCELAYEAALSELKTVLKEHKLIVQTSDDIKDVKDFLQQRSLMLRKCKGVIFLTSNWNSDWFKGNFNEVIKAKALRKTNSYGFLWILSREITQLPPTITSDVALITMNGTFDNNLITSMLANVVF